jgi:hypothetical protein
MDIPISPPGHIEIDTRQLNGLRAFYWRTAVENPRIDLCVHCLGRQPSAFPGRKLENELDARTVFMGTLLAAQVLRMKEGVGTILNLASLDDSGSIDPGMVRNALELVFAVTRYAAETAPQKIRALAIVPAVATLLSASYPDVAGLQLELSGLKTDRERRTLLHLIRGLLGDNKWLLEPPSRQTILLS